MNYLRNALTWLAPAILVAAAYGVAFLVESVVYALHMPENRLSFGIALVAFGMEFVLIAFFSLAIAGIEAPSKGNWFHDHLRHACVVYGLTLFAILGLALGAGHVSGALTYTVCLMSGAVAGNAFALYLTYEYGRTAT